MKKLTMALALILCLVLVVFAFASCGKKKNSTPATTAEPTGTATEPTTTATQPAHVHTPESKWRVETAPTCQTEGSESLYCAECGEKMETRAIAADPEAHVVNEWTRVEPTLLDPVGSESGVCTICEKTIENELEYELYVYDSMNPDGPYADSNSYTFRKKVSDIRGEDCFHPTEADDDGKDLWFEYSFLWNDTLYNRDTPENLAEIRMFGFRDTNNWSSYRGFYYLYLRDNMDPFKTSTDCPWRGHIDFSTYYPGSTPGENCALDLSDEGNTLNGKPIGRYIAGWGGGRDDAPYLWDSEYQTMGGWHRIGFHYHQEAQINDTTVSYSGYTELFIDGVKCWKVLTNMEGFQKDGKWKETDWSLKEKGLLLWTATVDPETKEVTYADNDAMTIEMRVDSVALSSKSVLIAVDDPRWTCGDGFAVDVVRVENPKPVELELADGVIVDGAMYYAKPGCTHEAEEEYTVISEATLLEDGTQAKFCAKCGERVGDVETFKYEPIVISSSWDAVAREQYNEENGVDWLNHSDLTDGIMIKKSINKIKSDDEHYYPTEENSLGNDLLVEVSLLWNETLKNTYSWEALTFGHIDGYDVFNVDSKIHPKDNRTRKVDGVDTPYQYSYVYPTEGTHTPSIGEYGWHRLGFRVHEDAEVDGEGVKYTYLASAYLDGNLMITFDLTDWVVNRPASTVTALLYTAQNVDGELQYFDIGEDPNSEFKTSYALLFFEEFFKKAGGYCVLGDIIMTCGQDFVQQVKPVAEPAEATFNITPEISASAKMWYEAK